MVLDLPEFWQRLPSDFWQHLGSYKYLNYKSQLQILLLSCVRKSFLVLDAGCGSNAGYPIKIPVDAQGIGMDISRANIEKSIKISKENRNNQLSFVVGDIEKMPFRENIFDVIISQDVLEHVKDKENAIFGIAFSLKRGGKIIASTTNAFNPAMFVDNHLPKKVSGTIVRLLKGDEWYEREGRLNPWSLHKILVKHGIIVKKLLLFGHPPFGQPWIYQYSNAKPPRIFLLWILFNKLTDFHFFKKFKEIMVFVGEKRLDRRYAASFR